MISHAWRAVIMFSLIVLLIIGGVTFSVIYTQQTVHQLCGIINTVVKQTSPKTDKHSTLYVDFVQLQKEYDC